MNRSGMKHVRLILVISLAGILLPAAGPWASQAQADQIEWSIFSKDAEYFKKVQADPRKLVEAYCQAEYNGVQDIRLKVAKASPKVASSDREPSQVKGGAPGRAINFSSDPFIVVDSYQVKSVSATDDRAEAVVVFKRLANCDVTEKRRFAVDRNSRDTVSLSLEYDGSSWWIVDPPLPRISKWALIEFSERIISSMNGIVKAGKASDGQKRYYESHRSIVAFLKGL
jgi:hypothetical protein